MFIKKLRAYFHLIVTLSVLTQEYVAKSHNLALMSAEQEARLLPVTSKASPVTASVCPGDDNH